MTTSTIPLPLITAQPSTTPYYRLFYNASTKKVSSLSYKGMVASGGPAGDILFTALTYAEIQTEAASLGLTGLPAQVTGQP